MEQKNKLYRAGSICMIALGILHTLYFVFSVVSEEPVIYDTLSGVTKKGVAWFLGERSLLSYYNGYSLSMGLLLISYGLLTLITNRTYKATVLSIVISFVAFAISVAYFHMLAYVLMALSTICYMLSLAAKGKVVEKAVAGKVEELVHHFEQQNNRQLSEVASSE